MTKKRRNNILAVIILIVTFIGIRVYQNFVKQENIQISKKGSTTVGKIIKRDVPGARTISNIGYKFIYYVDGKWVENWNSYDKKYSVDSYFEVTFLPKYPEKSRMEFDKPVHPDSVCNYFEGKCPFLTN